MIIAYAKASRIITSFPGIIFTERKGRSVHLATLAQPDSTEETDVLLRVRYDIRGNWHKCFSCKYNQLDSKFLQNG